MALHSGLLEREARGEPLRLGVIGAGKFGTMFLSQARHLPGLHVMGVADLDPHRAASNMDLAGWEPERTAATHLDTAARMHGTFLTDDASALIDDPRIEVIVECTGDPVIAVDHAVRAFAARKHVVSATVEADAVCGAALAHAARDAGVVYSMAYGDQPAMTCDLVDWARTCGFEVVAAGRGHKWKPDYRYSTPETVWDHWGLSAEQAETGRLNSKMFNSFLDGTKPAIETAAIANACGLDAPEDGLSYPAGSIDQIPDLMRPREEGGVLARAGQVEVINCLDAQGAEIRYDIRMGVFVVARAVTDYHRQCFAEYKVTTDSSGRYFCAYKRWHLIGLELAVSVANVGLRGEATGAAAEFRADVVAVAKRDLKPGDILDGEGGASVAGALRPANASVAMGALPLGLTQGAAMTRAVQRDAILTYDDVAPLAPSTALTMRRTMEAPFTAD